MNETPNPIPITPQLQQPISPPQTPTPPSPKPINTLAIILAILLAISLTIGGYFAYRYYQYRTYAEPVIDDSLIVAPTPNSTNQPQATLMPELTYEESQLVNNPGPVIVFTPPLDEFDYDGERTEIHDKIISPVVDYYAIPDAGGGLASITIEINSNPDSLAQYPYTMVAVMKNGGELGVALSKTNGILDWWLPECMGPCPYTPEFKAKYPEIVAKTN